jgi:hypothetical protein
LATASELLAMANGAPFEPRYNYRTQPLGTLDGEAGLTVPYNMSAEAVIHVRNWSALRPRRVLVEAVSPQRGGTRQVKEKGNPNFGRTPEELQRLVKDEGRDMNWYEYKIAPIPFGLRFDGQVVEIRPDLEEVDVKNPDTGEYHMEKQPKWYLIKPGAWDLYMGNFERMQSRNNMERSKEMEQLNNRGLHRWVLSADNPYGILEFKREEIRYETQRVDRDRVSAGEIIEV